MRRPRSTLMSVAISLAPGPLSSNVEALPPRVGHHADAAARFARAYAAGGGPEALWQNAQALFAAGDHDAAEQTLTLWATLVPDGMEKLKEARAELRGGKN